VRYLTLVADYTGAPLRESDGTVIGPDDLRLPPHIWNDLDAWNQRYREVLPLDEEGRKKRRGEIRVLDQKGRELAVLIETLVPGGAKVAYYSEGAGQLQKPG